MIREELTRINEDDYIGHYTVANGTLYVDSNFLNKMNSLSLGLDHAGFGDFFTTKPLKVGNTSIFLEFNRTSSKIDGFVGRTHSVTLTDGSKQKINVGTVLNPLIQLLKQHHIV